MWLPGYNLGESVKKIKPTAIFAKPGSLVTPAVEYFSKKNQQRIHNSAQVLRIVSYSFVSSKPKN